MVKITNTGTWVVCSTPYHPLFPAAARNLGGKFHLDKTWRFDPRDEQRVRDLCLDIWGTDGSPCELVTLRVVAAQAVWERVENPPTRYVAGRLVAKVFDSYDTRAKLGEGVVLLSGRFFGDGSRRQPRCGWSDGTCFELRDVPLAKARELQQQHPELIELLDSPHSPPADQVAVPPHIQALMDERRQIAQRMAQIDQQLLSHLPQRAASIPVYEVANELRDHD